MGQNLGFFTGDILKYFEAVQHIREAIATHFITVKHQNAVNTHALKHQRIPKVGAAFSWFWSGFEQVGKRRGLGWRGFGAVGAKMNQFPRFFAIS